MWLKTERLIFKCIFKIEDSDVDWIYLAPDRVKRLARVERTKIWLQKMRKFLEKERNYCSPGQEFAPCS